MNHFDTLPDELVALMIRDMDAKSYMMFQRTSKRMYEISKDSIPDIKFTIDKNYIINLVYDGLRNLTIKYRYGNYEKLEDFNGHPVVEFSDIIILTEHNIPHAFKNKCISCYHTKSPHSLAWFEIYK